MHRFQNNDLVIVHYGGRYAGMVGTIIQELPDSRNGEKRFKIRIELPSGKRTYMNRKASELELFQMRVPGVTDSELKEAMKTEDKSFSGEYPKADLENLAREMEKVPSPKKRSWIARFRDWF